MTDMPNLTSSTLISASKIDGTTVYNMSGEKLGSVDDILIDKVSGRAIYAVMSFGGFLGMGETYHPLPWASLTYDAGKGGYVVQLSKAQMDGAPSYERNSDFAWTPDYGRKVDKFYDVESFWGR
eukprot:gene28921-32375_t